MRRGEVWSVNLDPTVGAEMQKTRPVVIISSDLMGKLPLRVVVPLTDWKDHYARAPWILKVEPDLQNGIEKISSIDCFQLRSISEQRFSRRLGRLPDGVIDELVKRIWMVLTA